MRLARSVADLGVLRSVHSVDEPKLEQRGVTPARIRCGCIAATMVVEVLRLQVALGLSRGPDAGFPDRCTMEGQTIGSAFRVHTHTRMERKVSNEMLPRPKM
jgi:hypothetical protein